MTATILKFEKRKPKISMTFFGMPMHWVTGEPVLVGELLVGHIYIYSFNYDWSGMVVREIEWFPA